LKNIIDEIQLGLCVVKKIDFTDTKKYSNRKSLDICYFNNMFLDLLKIKQNIKSKEILDTFKEFIFFNEDENNISFYNNNNKENYNSNLDSNINNLSFNEKNKIDLNEKTFISEIIDKSKESKDNFNLKTVKNNLISINETNILNSDLNLNINRIQYSNSNKNLFKFSLNPTSNNSLKFISRKSKLLRALDLYDILHDYLNRDKEQQKEKINEISLEEENSLEKIRISNKEYKIDKINGNSNNKIFENSLEKESNNILNGKKKLNFNKDNKNSESPLVKSKNFSNGKNHFNFMNKRSDVKEYRFMRQNNIFTVKIQEINNFLVLIFENLDEEKKQIQNNIMKSFKNQYIITISHELNNPLNGLIHSIEELEFDEEEKKKIVYKKIKRFKFMIKFFLKNVITNFKFFLNEPVQKKQSNISFSFILESIKRSLFEFYEYKNITVEHDFSNLNKIILQYDYFYFRYLLKNIFMYFYYKIPRNGRFIIEIEKENEIFDLNDSIKGESNSSILNSSVESKSFDFVENQDKNENLNFKKIKKGFNESSNNKKNHKKKISMILKTENLINDSKRSSRILFDKPDLENFDIENSIQTLEMLIESINKISKLLGIKTDFSNFSKKNTTIQINMNYINDEDKSCLYNDINEFNEEYEKEKANCIFSINRTLINEEKKVYLNPTLNFQVLSNQHLFHQYNLYNRNLISNNKIENNNLNESDPNKYFVNTLNCFDHNANKNRQKNFTKDFIDVNKLNSVYFKTGLNYSNSHSNEYYSNKVIDNSNQETNINGNDIKSRNISEVAISNNSMYLSSSKNELEKIENEKNKDINKYTSESIHQLEEFEVDGNTYLKKSGYFLVKEKLQKSKKLYLKEKNETSLFSKQKINKNRLFSSTICDGIRKSLNKLDKEKPKDILLSKINSTKKPNIFIEEALNNSCETVNQKKIIIENFIDENLIEDDKKSINSLIKNFSDKIDSNYDEESNYYLEKSISENLASLASSETNSNFMIDSKDEENELENENINNKKKSNEGMKEILFNVNNIKNGIQNKNNNKLFQYQEDLNSINNLFKENTIKKNLLKCNTLDNSNKIYFNTYNTYLNINNIQKSNNFESSLKNENPKNNLNFEEEKIKNKLISFSKDEFLKKFCLSKNQKDGLSSPDSKNILKDNIKNADDNLKNEPYVIFKNKYFDDNETEKINPNNYSSINLYDKKKKKNLNKIIKDIDNNLSTRDFNFSREYYNMKSNINLNNMKNKVSFKNENLNFYCESENDCYIKNKEKKYKEFNTDIFDKNIERDNRNTELSNVKDKGDADIFDVDEYYDNYSQNTININKDIKNNKMTFMKNPFGNTNQQINQNYIRSPRLFFHCRIPGQNNDNNKKKVKRRNSRKSENSDKSNKKCNCNNILLVDDELFNLSSLNFLLKKKNLFADNAINGRESIDKIKEKIKKNCLECNSKEYKLIFMDIMMPELDGIEACNIIQEMVNEKTLSENIKVLILTAHDSDIIRKRAGKIKIIKEFVSKPVKRSVIDELLNNHYYSIFSK